MANEPKGWKGAGPSEEELHHILYDGELSTTNANTSLTLFDNTEAGVGLDQCNMPVASQLPATQRFLVKAVSCHFNDVLSSADAENLLDRASFELRVNQRRMLAGPLREFMSEKTVVPAGVTQDEQYFMGGTYHLDIPIMIPGGTQFNVYIETGETAAGASTEITCNLHGTLVRPA